MLNSYVNVSVEQLDIMFSYDEVLKALTELKCGISAGIDCKIPEIFIKCKDIITP